MFMFSVRQTTFFLVQAVLTLSEQMVDLQINPDSFVWVPTNNLPVLTQNQ